MTSKSTPPCCVRLKVSFCEPYHKDPASSTGMPPLFGTAHTDEYLLGFNEFIHDRELKPASESSIRLFDEIIMAKKARGRPGLTASLSRLSTIRQSHGASANSRGLEPPSRSSRMPSYLGDTSDHIWRTASVPLPKGGQFPGDYRSIITRTPARLDKTLMREPRAIQGVPREQRGIRGLLRKQVPSMLATSPPT